MTKTSLHVALCISDIEIWPINQINQFSRGASEIPATSACMAVSRHQLLQAHLSANQLFAVNGTENVNVVFFMKYQMN